MVQVVNEEIGYKAKQPKLKSIVDKVKEVNERDNGKKKVKENKNVDGKKPKSEIPPYK